MQEPQQQLRRLQELQQQTSSLLAAAAELAKQGASRHTCRQAAVHGSIWAPKLQDSSTPACRGVKMQEGALNGSSDLHQHVNSCPATGA